MGLIFSLANLSLTIAGMHVVFSELDLVVERLLHRPGQPERRTMEEGWERLVEGPDQVILSPGRIPLTSRVNLETWNHRGPCSAPADLLVMKTVRRKKWGCPLGLEKQLTNAGWPELVTDSVCGVGLETSTFIFYLVMLTRLPVNYSALQVSSWVFWSLTGKKNGTAGVVSEVIHLKDLVVLFTSFGREDQYSNL